MAIVRRLGEFVQKITTGLRVADQRFVRESVLGMVERGSTMLTEIGRGLKEPVELKQTEKRLSRMAGTKHFDDDRLRSNYLREAGPLTAERLPLVAVDMTEIAKPHGKAMEGLCLVRDASSRRKRLTGGKRRSRRKGSGKRRMPATPAGKAATRRSGRSRPEKQADVVPGYWVFEADATHPAEHHVVPLLTEVWSTEEPDFKSQNDVIERWLRYLAPYVAATAVWLFDRGFDGGYVLRTLIDLKLHWVVRMVGSRNVEFADGPHRMDQLAEGLLLPHATWVQTRVGGSRDVSHLVRFTFIPIHLHDFDGPLGLVVASMGRHKRMMLLCWHVPASADEAAQFLRGYLRRWSVEDGARAAKQLVGIEDVRVQSLRAVARLVRLAGIAIGWLGLLLLFARRTAARILARAKTVGREPLFLVYRLVEGIRHPA